ncbi:MAG TPA: hypothetical protein VK166_12085 [Chitinophagaceae bacterium]|nr:hypothetical protein [Chitinophagaceae bacterium]
MKKHHRLSGIAIAIMLSLVHFSCKKESTNPSTLPSGIPSLSTGPLADITPVSALCNAISISEGIEPTWYRGIVWGTAPNPTVPDHLWPLNPPKDLFWDFNAVKGTGAFGFSMYNLKPMTKYWVRAFARNKAGTAYGNELSLTTPELKIGQNLFKGYVAHIDSTGQHGLIVSNELQKSVWYNGQYIKTEATSLIDGYTNTGTIVFAQKIEKEYAAYNCFIIDLSAYGHTWFLPAKDQLNLLYQQASIIPGLTNSSYWSSTEQDEKLAWSQDFSTGKQSLTDKASSLAVRAFRRF